MSMHQEIESKEIDWEKWFYPNALTANHPLKSWFGVLALPAVHNSYWVDRQGNTHQFKPV